MGNCMKASRQIREEEEEERKQYQDFNQKIEEEEEEFGKKRGIKVKIVLTKEELERLMYELKANGGRKLEDVLQEIDSDREKIGKIRGAWKPSLASIIESHEG